MSMGRLTAKTKSPFWNTLYLTFLLKAFEIRAWHNSMRCWACSRLSYRASSSWRRTQSLSSLVILVAKATRSDGIGISKGITASHLYTREKGVLPVGVRTVVR